MDARQLARSERSEPRSYGAKLLRRGVGGDEVADLPKAVEVMHVASQGGDGRDGHARVRGGEPVGEVQLSVRQLHALGVQRQQG